MRLLAAISLLLLATPSLAEPDPLRVELACQPERDSGRLICRLDYRTAPSARLVWADALVTSAPPFVRPLRARVAAQVERDGASARAGIALVASGAGSGRISVRGRAVLCAAGPPKDAGSCRASEIEASAQLVLP